MPNSSNPDHDLGSPGMSRATVLVGIGGAVGGLARVGVAELLPHAPGAWAWSTLLANASGCAALAVLVVVLAARFPASPDLRLLLGTGVLGGYTTFSTFTVDVIDLLRAGREPMAGAYIGVSLATMLLATMLGLTLARAAFGTRGER